MKRFSFNIRKLRNADNKIIKFQEELDVLITSEEFITKFRGYIEDIALYKTVKGRKFKRSTDYAAIGIMDINDIIQEAYLAFLEAYDSYKNSKDNFENGAAVWSYLKKSTVLNLEAQLRAKKDGIRVTHHGQFVSKSLNTNLLTTLFSQMEKVFFRNQEDVALTKWETDLVGSFLDVHMDENLDFKSTGTRNLRGIEREVVKRFYGLDGLRVSYSDLSEQYETSISSLKSVKNRALRKLKSDKSKEEIAYFLKEYRIKTKADYENI